jgi:hypothetical protein
MFLQQVNDELNLEEIRAYWHLYAPNVNASEHMQSFYRVKTFNCSGRGANVASAISNTIKDVTRTTSHYGGTY